MVAYNIQYELHSLRVHLGEKRVEDGIIPREQALLGGVVHPAGVDPFEVAGPVAVDRGAGHGIVHRHRPDLLEQRRSPDRRNAERPEVAELVDHALKIASPVLVPVLLRRIEHVIIHPLLPGITRGESIEDEKVNGFRSKLDIRTGKNPEIHVNGFHTVVGAGSSPRVSPALDIVPNDGPENLCPWELFANVMPWCRKDHFVS